MSFTEGERLALKAVREVGLGTILFRNSLAKSLDLNLTESLCLTLLGIQESLSPSRLAKLVGLTTGATTTLLDRLERQGLVERRANPHDRRGVEIVLTSTYQEKAQKLVEGVQKAHRELLQSYSEEELALITGFLMKFTQNLKEHSSDVRELLG